MVNSRDIQQVTPRKLTRPLSDRVIAVISPGWAMKRAQARLRYELATIGLSTYKAAERSRNTADWNTANKTSDQAVITDDPTMRARARAAVRDDWQGRSIVKGHIRHIVGTGIWPRANARNPSTNDTLTDFNKAANKLFLRWARNPKLVDVEKRKTFWRMQALAVREACTVGHSLIVINLVDRTDGVGLVLQMLETEQLNTTITTFRPPAGGQARDVKGGIEVDEFGAAVAYHVFAKGRHPLEGGVRSVECERIPAERVIHYMAAERVRQTYGESWLCAVLSDIWHCSQFEAYTRLRARFEACGGATIESEIGADPSLIMGALTGTATDSADVNANKQFNFEPNMLWPLGPGQKAVFHDPKVPGGQHVPYTVQQIKNASAGAGLDYCTVSRDYLGGTYSGQRLGLAEQNLETDPAQQELIDIMVRPIYEAFITQAVKEGHLTAPQFDTQPDWRAEYLEANFRVPAKPYLSPLDEARAMEILVKGRFASRTKLLAEHGEELDDTFHEIAEEAALADELDIYLPEGKAEPPAPANPAPAGARRPDARPGDPEPEPPPRGEEE